MPTTEAQLPDRPQRAQGIPSARVEPAEMPVAPPPTAATVDLLNTMTGYQLLTTNEVAAILRVSPGKVRQLHRSGRLRAHPDFPTKLLFRVRDVLAFIRGE